MNTHRQGSAQVRFWPLNSNTMARLIRIAIHQFSLENVVVQCHETPMLSGYHFTCLQVSYMQPLQPLALGKSWVKLVVKLFESSKVRT